MNYSAIVYSPVTEWSGDENRNLLYALGYDNLRAYDLIGTETEPKLKEKHRWKIPGEKGGHDLVEDPTNDDLLLLSEHHSVWTFDKKSGQFREYEPFERKARY